MRLINSWALAVLTLGLCATLSWAGDVLNVQKVGTLLAKPESYQSKTVRITGIVSDYHFKHLGGGIATNVSRCVQIFTVHDETGSIYASYGTDCSPAMNYLRERDRVTVEARVEWAPGKAAMLNVQSVLSKVSLFE
jgi:hypothetical protein